MHTHSQPIRRPYSVESGPLQTCRNLHLNCMDLIMWLKMAQVNARMATADRDTQGQAAHGQYKSHIVVEFASGKSMHNRHS